MKQAEVEKYTHLLEDHRPHLYNPVTGQIVSADVNVADSIVIGDKMEKEYVASFPNGFYDPISSPIKMMSILKKQIKGKRIKPVIDLQRILLWLLMIGQWRQMELGSLFAYELCAVPSSLIDGYGCLQKDNKSGLMKCLAVLKVLPTPADIVIVDVSQLFYHIVWPHSGSHTDLIASTQRHLGHYEDGTEKIIVFDKYQYVSAMDHERMWQAGGEVILNYEFSIASPLPKRDAILKSKNNNWRLASVLGTFSLGENATMDTREDGAFSDQEADITMISYVLEAAYDGKGVICMLSDDTDVFVLLVYWV